MFQRILTDLERRKLKAYLKADGTKESIIRGLASRAKRHVPQIREDLELLEQLIETYEKHKTH